MDLEQPPSSTSPVASSISAPSPAASSGTTSTTTTGRSSSPSRSRALSPGSRTVPGSECGRARRFAGASNRDPGRPGLRLSGGASVRLARGPCCAGVRSRLRRRQHGALLSPCPTRVSTASPREQPRGEHHVFRARRAPLRKADAGDHRRRLQDAVLRFRERAPRPASGSGHGWSGSTTSALRRRIPRLRRTVWTGATGHSLCPSAPETIEYVAALAADVAARFTPETIDLEAWLYPAWEPSYTLTLALDPLDWRAELLATQCFCEHCHRLLGPGADELQHRARRAAVHRSPGPATTTTATR